jgi:hypothetical protein
MRQPIAAIALLVILLTGPASGLASGPEREDERRSGKDEIGRPLAEIAAGKGDSRTLKIEVEWYGESSSSARLFGSGVGIWNDRVQLRLSRSDVLSIASALKEAGFGAMPAQFGEEAEPLRLSGKMTVSILGKTKGVVQLASGEQSETFSALASRILDLSRERAKTGVTASSLADALAKLSKGTLPPEALRLTAHRRPEHLDTAARGWLLQLEGRQALARPFAPRGGYGTTKRLELPEAELRSLITLLEESDPAGFPSNLYASDYTELRIEALHWSRDLLARRSQDVTPQTHGDRQRAFDRIVELLGRLEARVEKEGREDPGP